MQTIKENQVSVSARVVYETTWEDKKIAGLLYDKIAVRIEYDPALWPGFVVEHNLSTNPNNGYIVFKTSNPFASLRAVTWLDKMEHITSLSWLWCISAMFLNRLFDPLWWVSVDLHTLEDVHAFSCAKRDGTPIPDDFLNAVLSLCAENQRLRDIVLREIATGILVWNPSFATHNVMVPTDELIVAEERLMLETCCFERTASFFAWMWIQQSAGSVQWSCKQPEAFFAAVVNLFATWISETNVEVHARYSPDEVYAAAIVCVSRNVLFRSMFSEAEPGVVERAIFGLAHGWVNGRSPSIGLDTAKNIEELVKMF